MTSVGNYYQTVATNLLCLFTCLNVEYILFLNVVVKGLADIMLNHDSCRTGIHVIKCTLCLKSTLQLQMLSLYKL